MLSYRAHRFAQRAEFVQLAVAARLGESAAQAAALARGFFAVVPAPLMRLFTWQECELLVCGSPTVDVNLLRKYTLYRSLSGNEPHIKFFWEVLTEMSDAMRAQFLRFAWGRQRMPPESELAAEHMKIFPLESDSPDQHFPHAETCFFNIRIPAYSSKAVLRERLEYAIQNTVSMDDDPAVTFTGPGTGRHGAPGGLFGDDE